VSQSVGHAHLPDVHVVYIETHTKKKEANKRTSLQPVDVLRVHPQELTLPLEQPHKVVRRVGPVTPRVELLGQGEEGPGVPAEEAELEDGLGVGQAVLLQVVIETAAWRPEGGATRT